jgi:N-acetylneuraminate synthase
MSYFIAEVSSNHSKDIKRALDFVDVAADIGCDAVKFQLFRIDELFSQEILAKSEEHRRRVEWELPIDFLPHLSERCKKRGIDFSCTPFYLDAVRELEQYVDFYKVASYELLWNDLHLKCAQSGKPVIISSGMANLQEISNAVEIYKSNGCNDLTVLHCTSAYPTPTNEANLAAIETIRNANNCKVGWSDHTVNDEIINRAIHRWGASIIEFHIDIEGKGDEFESGHCWLPNQIEKVIRNNKNGAVSKKYSSKDKMIFDGDGLKEPVKSEISDRDWRADPSDGLRPMLHIRSTF